MARVLPAVFERSSCKKDLADLVLVLSNMLMALDPCALGGTVQSEFSEPDSQKRVSARPMAMVKKIFTLISRGKASTSA